MKENFGAASLRIELKKGVITFRHGETGELLLEGIANQESWDKILVAAVHSLDAPKGLLVDGLRSERKIRK